MEGSTIIETVVLEQILRHNTWASVRLIEACEALGEEQLGATVPGTFGTIYDTLLHMVTAEISYVWRITGEKPEPPPEGARVPLSWLRGDIEWCGTELLNIVASEPADRQITRVNEGVYRRYPLTGVVMQAVHHANEHRTQVATTLTHIGVEPPDMSGWHYMYETGQMEERPAD